MTIHRKRRETMLRATFMAAAAWSVFPLSVFAKDLPATAEGARKLGDRFTTVLGAPAPGVPAPVVVTPEAGRYVVAIDLVSLAAPLSGLGLSIDPATMELLMTEQDDGTWRVSADSFPPISIHAQTLSYVYRFADYRFDGLYDPDLSWFRSAKLSAARPALEAHLPNMDEAVGASALTANFAATPANNGAISMVMHEEVADMTAKILASPGEDKALAGAKPTPMSFQGGETLLDASFDGAPVRKLMELWAFAIAHPSRAQMAANEQGFKALLRGLVPTEMKLAEKAELKQFGFGAPQGTFGMTDGKFTLAGSTDPSGKGSGEYGFAVEGLTLPPGLVAPTMSDLVPTAFSVGIRASGFNPAAGANEAIDDLHLAGDGPVMSPEDRSKVLARLKGTGPILVELLPSRIRAPQVDIALEGEVHLEGVRPSGVLRIHARKFDDTIAAVKALGPLATPQVLGGLALAKGLAKSEPDGSLTWVAEYGADGAINVNGMPLGKAP
jgi:hypothetical protein